jgi:hypothetical protein
MAVSYSINSEDISTDFVDRISAHGELAVRSFTVAARLIGLRLGFALFEKADRRVIAPA